MDDGYLVVCPWWSDFGSDNLKFQPDLDNDYLAKHREKALFLNSDVI